MSKRIRQEILERFRAANPYPTTELNFSPPFKLLITALLSAQAANIDMNKATTKLFPVTNTPQVVLDLELDGAMGYTRTIGLYKTKSKHIMQTCRILLEKYSGEVPADRGALESLPGAGRKTADVVLNTVFGQPVMAVDTHIFRVANHAKIAPDKDMREAEDKLIRFIPKKFLMDAHHWLVLHGRYTCKTLKPQCNKCLTNDLCGYPAKL